jgi:hypothetical protein
MTTPPERDFDLELHFLPAWAQKPSADNRYADYAGGTDRPEGRRSDRRDRPPGRRDARPSRDAAGSRPGRGDRPGGPRREGRPSPQDRPRREERPPPPPLPIQVAFVPDDKGVDSLARQIKITGRSYPLFDIAQMILQKPERHTATLTVKPGPDGQPLQPLFACALDDTLWLSEDEAVRYVLDRHFSTFYQPERTKIDPPKGTYTFVAQCGMSGVILGPPNYHGYQEQLRKLHAEKFSRMPFDAFKGRVRIVRDEEVVKKWLDEQSWKTEYVCLNLPEPLKLSSVEEVEKHFRETHLANMVKRVEAFHLSGTACRNIRHPDLARLIRRCWEDQRRFPLQIATVLSQQFAGRGLQFFKVNRTVTHVAAARPHYLDLDATPVSEGVRKIVFFVNEHPKCTRRQLLQALIPAVAGSPAPAPAPEAAPADRSAEETQIISDLHWLIHQGHVIEFANGTLETAKKPAVRPPKPEVSPAARATSGDSASAVSAEPTKPTAIALEETAPGTDETALASSPILEPVATPEPSGPSVENGSTDRALVRDEDSSAGPVALS